MELKIDRWTLPLENYRVSGWQAASDTGEMLPEGGSRPAKNAPAQRAQRLRAYSTPHSQFEEFDMTLCPIAIAAGCKKCPAFSMCPLKSVIGDQPKAAQDSAKSPAAKSDKAP